MIFMQLLTLLFLLPSLAVAADKKKAAVEEEVQIVEAVDCVNGTDERRLEAQTKDAGCVLLYTKFRKTSQIGQARRGVELCRQKLKEVRANLERGGHKCK